MIWSNDTRPYRNEGSGESSGESSGNYGYRNFDDSKNVICSNDTRLCLDNGKSLDLWSERDDPQTKPPFNNYQECQKQVILDLTRNNIITIPKNYFYDLVLLQELNLKENQIREIPVELFQNNVELTILTLGNNRIKSLESNTFNGLVKLEELYLYSNQLENIPIELFQNNVELAYLELQANQLQGDFL